MLVQSLLNIVQSDVNKMMMFKRSLPNELYRTRRVRKAQTKGTHFPPELIKFMRFSAAFGANNELLFHWLPIYIQDTSCCQLWYRSTSNVSNEGIPFTLTTCSFNGNLSNGIEKQPSKLELYEDHRSEAVSTGET